MRNAPKQVVSEPRQRIALAPGAIKWWHGALFLAAITGLSSLAFVATSRREQDDFYENEHLPA